MTNTEALMTWARERLLRTKQKLKRTMISSADWPPPNLIYSSSVTCQQGQHGRLKGLSHAETDHEPLSKQAKPVKVVEVEEEDDDDDDGERSYQWLGSCCWRESSERRPAHRLSSMISGTYKIRHGRHHNAVTELVLKTGPDGSLICDNNVDINMLIAGFREFEKHLQYGALMPFVNVLPTAINPTPEEEGEEDSRLQEAADEEEGGASESSGQEPVRLKSLCRRRSTPAKDKRVSFADLQKADS
ncbi:unnamed protein product [Dibothriocephalus latus]|uniref:Uncharacterized protein n=1 Tax=Dibothriocephalus latus TaxID=60516 RepID=A0A3P7LI84_DIBLA|nr:unnamed protein product [Dibothriocephalus latus]